MAGGTRGPVPVPLRDETHKQDVTQDVLDSLDKRSPFDSSEEFPSISQAQIKAALDRLASRSMVAYDTRDTEQVLLTAESEAIVQNGSHEYRCWAAVKERGRVGLKELPVCGPNLVPGELLGETLDEYMGD